MTKKNEQDYEDITRRLNNALEAISRNPKLPATGAQVAKMADVGRNTVTNREFPAERLKEIRKQRKDEEEKKKLLAKSKNEILKEERDRIAKEVVFWFTEYTKAKQDRDDFENQLTRQIDNADFYKKEFEKQKDKIKALESKNEQLKELLRDMQK